MLNDVKNILNGKISLVKIFWLGLLALLILGFILDKLVPLVVTLSLAIPIGMIWLLGVWKSATNYNGLRLWAYLAKAYVIFVIWKILSMIVIFTIHSS